MALAVWQDVCARLAEDYARRAPPNRPTTCTLLIPREAPLGTRRQGWALWIDRDAEALLATHAFEPRPTRLRQRLAHVGVPRQPLAAQEALDPDGRLIMGELADVAAQVQDGLEDADWSGRREMNRALVTRVEVDHDQGQVVCRIEPRPGDPSSEKKKIVGEYLAPLGCFRLGREQFPRVHDPSFQPRPDVSSERRAGVPLAESGVMVDSVEALGYVGLQHPCGFLGDEDLNRSTKDWHSEVLL